MRVKGATFAQVEIAAQETAVRISDNGRWGQSGHVTARDGSFRFTIRTSGKDAPYRRASIYDVGILYWDAANVRRRKDGSVWLKTIPGAVCWHGHRDFMRALFRLAPDAVLYTALATYRGAEDFERTFSETDKNVGSTMRPVLFSESCFCAESPLPEAVKTEDGSR